MWSSSSPECLLCVSSGSSQEPRQSWKLTSTNVCVIGRDEECDLVLDGKGVSRRHVELRIVADGIRVQDLGSTNGIGYLGKRIEVATLSVGARISIGKHDIDLLPPTDIGAVPISSRESYGELLGISSSMRRIFSVLEMLESSDVPVLVQGETGTGKELIAQALHAHGLRAQGRLVVIDCGNMTSELIESELFGHVKGAFTGATTDRAGAFEVADGGTIFLDELSELPVTLQPKLLRVLESGQVRRLGTNDFRKVDVRVISASQRDLAVEVAAGNFRQDLYYRLVVAQILLPPLRERPEDIPVLAQHFLGRLSDNRDSRLPPEAVEQLLHHHWPGNVRELRNVIHCALVVPPGITAPSPPSPPSFGSQAEGQQAAPFQLRLTQSPHSSEPDTQAPVGDPSGPLKINLEIPANTPFREARTEMKQALESAYLSRLWAEFDGNISAASRASGIDRKSLRELLAKHGLI